MAGAYAEIRNNSPAIQKDIREFMEKIQNLKPLMEDFGEYMINVTRDERFDRQSDPQGSPWKELAQETLKRKKIKKILTETSNLKDRIIYDADAKSMKYGTNVIYGAIHQFGGNAGKGHKAEIPQREYLGFSEADLKEFETLFDEFVKEIL